MTLLYDVKYSFDDDGEALLTPLWHWGRAAWQHLSPDATRALLDRGLTVTVRTPVPGPHGTPEAKFRWRDARSAGRALVVELYWLDRPRPKVYLALRGAAVAGLSAAYVAFVERELGKAGWG